MGRRAEGRGRGRAEGEGGGERRSPTRKRGRRRTEKVLGLVSRTVVFGLEAVARCSVTSMSARGAPRRGILSSGILA